MVKGNLKNLAAATSNLSVLIVEDENSANQQMCDTFNMLFDKVYTAYDGQEGLEIYKKERPSVVFCDLIMPKMDGVELVKKIKSMNKDQTIVVVSATDQLEKITESIKIGVSSFLPKPINSKDLIEVLKQIATISKGGKKIETKTFSIKIPLDMYKVIEDEAYDSKTSKNAIILDILKDHYVNKVSTSSEE
jgi:YesN/AraC family two-component response regulator